MEFKTSLDNKGSRKIDGGNTSQCDKWAGPEQQVTDMQMQDWQGRKTVRSQQMDGDAQSSLEHARGCHTQPCLRSSSSSGSPLTCRAQPPASGGSLHWTPTGRGQGSSSRQCVSEEDAIARCHARRALGD